MQAIWAKIMSIIMAILAFFGLVKPETPAADPASYEVNGKVVTFCLDANPTTGYGWEAVVDGDCVTLTRDEYKQNESEPGMAGVGGYQYYELTAARPGTATVTFTYARSWETTDSDRTFVAEITVAEDLTVLVTSFGER